MHWKILLLYLDDIIIMAPDFDMHLARLRDVLERLRPAELKLKQSKCKLLKYQVKYLGLVVSAEDEANDPQKLEAVHKGQSPETSSSYERCWAR